MAHIVIQTLFLTLEAGYASVLEHALVYLTGKSPMSGCTKKRRRKRTQGSTYTHKLDEVDRAILMETKGSRVCIFKRGRTDPRRNDRGYPCRRYDQ